MMRKPSPVSQRRPDMAITTCALQSLANRLVAWQ